MDENIPEEDPQQNKKEPDGTGQDASKLHAVTKALYEREEGELIQKRSKDLMHLGSRKKINTAPEKEEASFDRMKNVMERRAGRRNKILLWGGILVIAITVFAAAAVFTMWYRNARNVAAEDIGITLQAPQDATAGQDITYDIEVTNNSALAWQDVVVRFDVPEGFMFETSAPQATRDGKAYVVTVGTLDAGQVSDLTVTGNLIGEQDGVALARAHVTIHPSNVPQATLEASETVSTRIAAVPLDISIDAPPEGPDGEAFSAVIHVRNLSENALSDIIVALKPAPGLSVAFDNEEFSRGYDIRSNSWNVLRIEPLDEVVRTAVLVPDGLPGDRRTVEVVASLVRNDKAYVQRTVPHVIALSASELALSQTFEPDTGGSDAFVAGQPVDAEIQYKNTGTSALGDVVVTATFDGTGLDPETLNLPAGSYDPTNKTITWTAASVPELETVLPQQGGTIKYSFSLLSVDAFATDDSAKNQNFSVTTIINSPDIVTAPGQPTRTFKDVFTHPIVTNLTLDVDALYDDGRLGITSEGPVPPKVGETTTYTVRFRLGSTLNDVGDVKMVAILPDGVSYTDRTYITAGSVNYNDRTGEVIWDVPLLDGLSGRGMPPLELHIQVSITPGENVRGDTLDLVQEARVSGTDAFASVGIEYRVDNLPTTNTAVPNQGKVQ